MIQIPTFLQSRDFFETTLLEDLPLGGSEIRLPSTAMAVLPEYPFPLTLGEAPNDLMVLCTGDAESNGVPNGRIAINPTFFNPEGIRTVFPKETPVYAAVSFHMFKEIQSYLIELTKEYKGVYSLFASLLGFGNLSTSGIYDFNGMGNSFLVNFNTSGDPEVAIDIAPGLAISNNRFVSTLGSTTLDLYEYTNGIPIGQSVGILVSISDLSEITITKGNPTSGTPTIPSPPQHHLPLASFTMNITGFAVGTLTDERGTLLNMPSGG